MSAKILLATLLWLTGGAVQAIDLLEHQAATDAWHAGRIERLRAEDGWLALVGLHPLAAGENTLGTADDRDCRLDATAPPHVGTLDLAPDGIVFTPAPDARVSVDGLLLDGPQPVVTDTEGAPTVFRVGSVRFHVIGRGDRFFLRVKDAQSPVRSGFTGIDRYPVDPAWRITARLITEGQPATVPVVNVLGQEELQPSPGVLEFEVAGRTCRLRPVGEPGQSLFIVFADLTSGHETYGGGRFLSTDAPDAAGRVVLDFNRAVNPPCAFTPHATCPMPSFENRLPVAVTAGEKSWGAPH